MQGFLLSLLAGYQARERCGGGLLKVTRMWSWGGLSIFHLAVFVMLCLFRGSQLLRYLQECASHTMCNQDARGFACLARMPFFSYIVLITVNAFMRATPSCAHINVTMSCVWFLCFKEQCCPSLLLSSSFFLSCSLRCVRLVTLPRKTQLCLTRLSGSILNIRTRSALLQMPICQLCWKV